MTTVLVADDDLAMRVLITATLEPDGYRLVEAEDGDEAWELLRAVQPDVALLDVQMGGRTGIELTRLIRQDPRLATMAVLVVSAKTQAPDVVAGFAAGADEYVSKPFSPGRLASLVREWSGKAADRRRPGVA